MRIVLLFYAAAIMTLNRNSAQAAPVLYSGNGHYYDRVATTLTFDQAVAAAAASTYNGLQGYLVTITSQAERDFVYSLFPSSSWAGGSDAQAVAARRPQINGRTQNRYRRLHRRSQRKPQAI